MKLKYCDNPHEPKIIDNSTLQCFVYEPFVIDTGEVLEVELGFTIDVPLVRVARIAFRYDDVFVYCIIPGRWAIRIINLGEKRTFDRGEFLCDVIFIMKFTLTWN